MKVEINKQDVGLVMNAVAKSMAIDIQLEIQRLIDMESGYATGELRNSIQIKEEGDGWSVYSDKEYAPFLEYGTGLFVAPGHGSPHLIKPIKKKVLSWIDPRTGKRVFAKSVKGIQPRWFFNKSLDLVQAQYTNDITRKIMQHLTGASKVSMAEKFEGTGSVIGRSLD